MAADRSKAGVDQALPPASGSASARGATVLALLLAVPVVFARGTGDAFEPPKAALLATGAAVLLAFALAGEFSRAEGTGLGAWWRSLPARGWRALRADPLGAAVLLFLLSSTLSTLVSVRPGLSVFGAPGRPAGLVTAWSTAAVYYASRSAAASPRWLARIALAASVAAAAACAYALVQLAGLDPIGWERTATFDGRWRVPGTLGHPNHLGAYLSMALPLVLLLARDARSRAARAAWILLAAIALLVLALTLSRGAWVGLAAGAVAYTALSRPRVTWRGVAVALVAAGIFLLPLFTPMGAGLLTRLRQVADTRAETTQTRLQMWRAGLRMLADHPVTGVGTDAFVAAYPRYRAPESWQAEWATLATKAHDELIQIGATQGGIGLLAALLVVAFAARALLRVSRAADPGASREAAAVGAALAAWGVSDLASFTVVATGSLAAALAGWAAARAGAGAASRARDGRLGVASPISPLPWAAATLVALALWAPLVLTPWRASRAAAAGLGLPLESPVREAALERAAVIAPWDERYASELGRTLLARAFVAPDPPRAWSLFSRARQAFEHAARIAPENAEDRALAARALAGQATLRPDLVPRRRVVVELEAALAADSTNAGALELATQGYVELGMDAEARRTALRCAALYPAFAHPMADLGTLALSEGRFADAADTLALASEREWHGDAVAEATTRAKLAFAYLRLGRPREAWVEADRSLRLHPAFEEARQVRDEAAAALRAGGG